SRFAIVDFNADAGTIEPPAEWSEEAQAFIGKDGKPVGKDAAATFQFHQVSVWALLQCALAFYEDPSALGRSILWAFEGNRLIVVPHAGFGENAFYDRDSKSLQFYYFDSNGETIYTCLSSDIVHHEFGHAVLDGVRPLFNESTDTQTGAFHEFMGDLSAILLTLKNRTLRRQLALKARGKFTKATTLSSVAEQFGQAVDGRPYLRTARNKATMGSVSNEVHDLSEVMTGAMFDVLIELGKRYDESVEDGGGVGAAANDADDRAGREKKKRKSPVQVFFNAADRMQRMAIQPLDLLPPVEVNFRDYALAVCRSQRLADPLDPRDYYGMLIKVFLKRKIFTAEDEKELKRPTYLTDRLDLAVRPHMDSLSRSRAAAHRFLDDNREYLLIPASRDFFVADLYEARKRGRQNLMMARQIVVQYAWREEVELSGAQFGKYDGKTTTMLCGGTLVFDDNGTVLSWMMKPGSEPYGRPLGRGKRTQRWAAAVTEGTARRAAFLENLAAQIAEGEVGVALETANGFVGASVPPVIAEEDGDRIRFRLAPHLHLSKDDQLLRTKTGERKWEISC
ncbi:MAG: serine protease, partial [Vicinamibacterales bacterium]